MTVFYAHARDRRRRAVHIKSLAASDAEPAEKQRFVFRPSAHAQWQYTVARSIVAWVFHFRAFGTHCIIIQ